MDFFIFQDNIWWCTAIKELAEALRDLHDLQNGPPLVGQEDEWVKVMERVAELLEKYETE